MVDIVGSGMLGFPLQGSEDLISNSAKFQSWVSAANATEALDNIFIIAEDEDSLPDTYALVYWAPGWTAEADGDSSNLVESGELIWRFARAIPEALLNDLRNQAMEFLNDLHDIMTETFTRSLLGGKLRISSFTIPDTVFREWTRNEQDRGVRMWTEITVRSGP